MISYKNISSVATYERKTLFRSWFFKIFSFLALFILFFIHVGFFGNHNGAFWSTRAIEANLPYLNVLFINVAQSIIAVFLASDFIRRDKKLDTTEVIYTRPISNAEYVIGKTLGILLLFIGLVAVSLITTLIFNFVKQDVPIAWPAYIYYILLITIPSLLFILGLAFTLMLLIKNQAVTFIVLLGYIGVTLFYFQDKLFGLLDYMAFNLPMIYSDIIQFTDLKLIILQRLAYASIGIGLIQLTIHFLGRLPQNRQGRPINFIFSLMVIGLGLSFAYTYHSDFEGMEKRREQFLALNNQLVNKPTVDILSNSLHVEHKGRQLIISSNIRMKNPNPVSLDTLVFSLNPGFNVDKIEGEEEYLEYIQTAQILQIIPANGLAPGERLKVRFTYSGVPEESIAYLDLPQKIRFEVKRIMAAPVNKKSVILNENYLLLTPEINWYPVAGVGFNSKTFQNRILDFTRFQLAVLHDTNLMAISQGRSKRTDGGTKFITKNNLASLALVIGKFERKSLVLDEVEYNLFFAPGHDFFSEYFTNIQDTIPTLIKSVKENYETQELDLFYPFKRINIVEAPVQFHAYERAQTQTNQYILPEMIFIPEKGAGINTLDFSRFKFFEDRRNKKQDNAKTEEQIEIDLLKRFLRRTFFREGLRSRPEFDQQWSEESIINYEGVNYTQNPYCAFPLYYSHVTGIQSNDYPLFNTMVEVYLKEGFETSPRQAMQGGLTEKEKANLALKDNSLDILFEEWDPELISGVVSQMSSFIIQGLKNRVGISEFDNFLYYYLEDHYYEAINFEQFSSDFYNEFKVDIKPYFEAISSNGKLPAFHLSTPEYLSSYDEVGEVYLVKLKITNSGKSKGIVDITFPASRRSSGSSEQRLYEIEAGETRDIQIVLYERPRGMMFINTLISENIPTITSSFLRSPRQITSRDFEEYSRISDIPVNLSVKEEYIVDNEDAGFKHISISGESKVKQYIDARKQEMEPVKYTTLHRWWSPSVWTPVSHSGYYGEIIRSAFVTRSGDGQNVAKWSALLDKAGNYDIYVYIPRTAMLERPNPRDRNQQNNNSGGGQRRGPKFPDEGNEYTYIVSSSEGTSDIKFVLKNVEDGWNKLGTFHFPADSVSVSLSNKITGRRVIADAVKWVKK